LAEALAIHDATVVHEDVPKGQTRGDLVRDAVARDFNAKEI
jgi:hypothetical protein